MYKGVGARSADFISFFLNISSNGEHYGCPQLLLISHENEMIGSHLDQIISFS